MTNPTVRRIFRLDRSSKDLKSLTLTGVICVALTVGSLTHAVTEPLNDPVAIGTLIVSIVSFALWLPMIAFNALELRSRARAGAAASDLPS